MNFKSKSVEQSISALCNVLEKDFTCKFPKNDPYVFAIRVGSKYYKIMQRQAVTGGSRTAGGSIHAFVDKSNGDLYKPASMSAPAKGVRFNVISDAEKLAKVADWAGSYLYKV